MTHRQVPLLKRRRFWWITGGAALVIFAFLVALGVIVGSSQPKSATAAANTSASAPTPTVSSAATPAPRSTTTPSATTTSPTPTQPPVLTTSVAPAQPPAAVTTPDYTVPKYVPPPPDGAGNPPCPLPSTWDTAGTGAGISAIVYRDPAAVTVTVWKKSGADESQSATIKPGQSLHQFDFPGVDKSSVAEVLAFSNGSRCYVTVF